jgi:hypothetical protein
VAFFMSGVSPVSSCVVFMRSALHIIATLESFLADQVMRGGRFRLRARLLRAVTYGDMAAVGVRCVHVCK